MSIKSATSQNGVSALLRNNLHLPPYEIDKVLSQLFENDLRKKVVQQIFSQKTEMRTSNQGRGIGTRSMRGIPSNVSKDILIRKKVDNCFTIFKVLAKIPGQEGDGLVPDLVTLFEGITEHYQRDAILKALSEIPSEEQADVIRCAASIITSITRDDNFYERADILRIILERADILRVLGKILSEERADVVRCAKPIITRDDNFYAPVGTLGVLGKIPRKERDGIAPSLAVLFSGIPNVGQEKSILGALDEIPLGERADVIRCAASIITRGDTYGVRIGILGTLGKIPREERDDIAPSLPVLFSGISNAGQEKDIPGALDEIPLGERVDVIRCAVLIIRGIIYGYVGHRKATILRVLGKIPREERDGIEPALVTLFEGIGYAYRVEVILGVLDEIPSKERADVIRYATKRVEGNFYAQAGIFGALGKIPREERDDVAPLLVVLFRGVEVISQLNAIFEALDEIPSKERADVIRCAAPIIGGSPSHQRGDILRLFQMVPPDARHNLCGILEDTELFQENLFRNVFSKYPEIRETVHSYAKWHTIPALQKNKDFMLLIIEQSRENLQYADDSLKCDPEFRSLVEGFSDLEI